MTQTDASRTDRPSPPHVMPAEWEPHAATWIAWPHHEPDWPGKLEAVHWVYAQIVRVLADSERVEILCHSDDIQELARNCLDRTGIEPAAYRFHRVPTDRAWLRDSAPTAVRAREGTVAWVAWRFNAWAKYDNYKRDVEVAARIAAITGLECIEARRPDTGGPLVLEGGALECDGEGTILVTEECLLSEVQQRNPGLDRAGYERALADYLGARKVIWLGRGCAGDDTHGHIDDVARFTSPGRVVLAYAPDPANADHDAGRDNLERLLHATDAAGRKLEVVTLPMPKPIFFEGDRLPASYANFYVANRTVLVPTFDDPADRIAQNILAAEFPERQTVGIHAVDLVLGLGTLHCLTQPQPADGGSQSI